MKNSKPIATPVSTSAKLKLSDGFRPCNDIKYRQLVGSIQYLAMIRPDISFVVNKMTQFMHVPRPPRNTSLILNESLDTSKGL